LALSRCIKIVELATRHLQWPMDRSAIINASVRAKLTGWSWRQTHLNKLGFP